MHLARGIAHAFFSHTARACGGHDDIIARLPISRQGHAEFIDCLKADENTFDFVEIAPEGQGVIDDGSDSVGKVDEEDGSDGLRGALARLHHAVLLGHFHAHVLHEGETHLDILHAAVFDAVLDGTQPGDVAVETVDGDPHKLAVQFLEFLGHVGESDELGGAHGGEIGGMAEEDFPLATVVARKMDGTLGGHSVEVGGMVADSGHGGLIVLHGTALEGDNPVSFVEHVDCIVFVFHNNLVFGG